MLNKFFADGSREGTRGLCPLGCSLDRAGSGYLHKKNDGASSMAAKVYSFLVRSPPLSAVGLIYWYVFAGAAEQARGEPAWPGDTPKPSPKHYALSDSPCQIVTACTGPPWLPVDTAHAESSPTV